MNQATRLSSCLLAFLCLAFSATAEGFFTIKSSNGKYGIVYVEGMVIKKEKWVIDPVYDSIINKGGGQNPWNKGEDDLVRFFYLLYKKGEVGVLRCASEGSRNWEMVLKCQFENVVMAKGMCSVKKDGKWGLFDGFRAVWLLEAEYDTVRLDHFTKEFAFNATATKNGKTGLFDIRGRTWVLPVEYDEAVIIPNFSVFTRKGEQRGIYYCNTNSDPYKYWLVPPGNYNSISYTKQQTGNFLVDSAGKKGLWQNYAESGPKSMCLIPAQYNNLRPVDEGHFITDSLGKMGLWTIERKQWMSSSASMLLPAVYSDLYVYSNNDLIAKQGEKVGVYNLRSGWKTRMNAVDANQRIYSIFGQTLTVKYKPGIGFDIDSDVSGTIQTMGILDKNPYDSFGLVSGNLLIAFKGRLGSLYYLHFIRGGKDILTGSQLLAEGVDYCATYPPKNNQARTLIENQAVVYRSKGIVTWHNVGALGSTPQLLTKVPVAVDDIDDYFIKNPASALGKQLMLVVHNKKYGIVTVDGQVIVPIVHPSFTDVVNKKLLSFQSPVAGKIRLFDINEASSGSLDPEWRGLTWANVNGKKVVDFNAIQEARSRKVYRVDTSWYYIENHQAKYTRVMNEGDVLERFDQAGQPFEVIEQRQGLGLRRGGKILIPPTMASITKFGGIIHITDTKLQKLSLPLGELASLDLAKGYDSYVPNIKCKTCNGAGSSMKSVTRTTPARTEYTTKEETYDKVIRDLNGNRTGVRSVTTTKNIPASSYTERVSVTCGVCNGAGSKSGIMKYRLKGDVFQVE